MNFLPVQATGINRTSGNALKNHSVRRGYSAIAPAQHIAGNCFGSCRSDCINDRPLGFPARIWANLCDRKCEIECLDPECGDCYPIFTPYKTCTIRTGPEEYATITVPCDSPLSDCDPCFYALEEKRECCKGDTCWTENCPLPTPAFQPFGT